MSGELLFNGVKEVTKGKESKITFVNNNDDLLTSHLTYVLQRKRGFQSCNRRLLFLSENMLVPCH